MRASKHRCFRALNCFLSESDRSDRFTWTPRLAEMLGYVGTRKGTVPWLGSRPTAHGADKSGEGHMLSQNPPPGHAMHSFPLWLGRQLLQSVTLVGGAGAQTLGPCRVRRSCLRREPTTVMQRCDGGAAFPGQGVAWARSGAGSSSGLAACGSARTYLALWRFLERRRWMGVSLE